MPVAVLGYPLLAATGAGVGTWIITHSWNRQSPHDQSQNAQQQADQATSAGASSQNCQNCMAAKQAEEEKKGQRPPNKAPEGADREEALAAAKKANNIPDDQEPDIKPNYGPNSTPDSKAIPGSENLEFIDRDGNIVEIRNDYDGHSYPDDPSQDRGPHFNDPAGNHYDYQGQNRNYGPLRR